MKKILVTGGAGFVGSHLCDYLIGQNYKVTCLDNLLTGSKKNVKHLSKNPNFEFIGADVVKPIDQLTNRPIDQPPINPLTS